MESNKILSADILDIIFEGKNKLYGAYDLRKTYDSRLRNALLAVVGLCIALFLFFFLNSTLNKGKKAEVLVEDVQLAEVKEEKKPEAPPPPPPPKQPEPPKVEITKFTPPKIVKDEEVKKEDEIKPVEDLKDTKIGTINQEGAKDENVVTPVVEAKGTGTAPAPKVEEDYDKLFTAVEIEAGFPGGLGQWAKFLEKNLNASVVTDAGAPPGKYQVVVSFIVDKNGNVSEVKAENDPGYGTAAEAVRVIKKGPKWNPGIQNGHQVTSRKRQTVTFLVNEE